MLFAPKDLIINKEIEMLNEANIMSYKCKGNNFSVDVVPEPNRSHGGKDAYFKVTPDADSYSKGKYETRVSFREPTYVEHPKGKPHKDLSAKQIDTLIDQFKKPSKNKDGNGLTNWQYAIHRFNMSCNTDNLESIDQSNPIVKKALTKGDYIPLDYPMPDYTKLQ